MGSNLNLLTYLTFIMSEFESGDNTRNEKFMEWLLAAGARFDKIIWPSTATVRFRISE